MSFLRLFEDKGNYIFLMPRDVFTGIDGFNANTLNDSEIIILSATEEFSRTDTTSVTEFPISSGSRHTDHYSVNPATVSFRGVIAPKLLNAFSAVESISSGAGLDSLSAPVKDYIKRVREIMLMSLNDTTKTRRSPLFTVYLPDGNQIENCVITSFGISRDSKVSDGYYVDVTVQEVFFADTQYNIVPLNDTVAVEAAQTNNTGVTTGDSSIAEDVTEIPITSN